MFDLKKLIRLAILTILMMVYLYASVNVFLVVSKRWPISEINNEDIVSSFPIDVETNKKNNTWYYGDTLIELSDVISKLGITEEEVFGKDYIDLVEVNNNKYINVDNLRILINEIRTHKMKGQNKFEIPITSVIQGSVVYFVKPVNSSIILGIPIPPYLNLYINIYNIIKRLLLMSTLCVIYLLLLRVLKPYTIDVVKDVIKGALKCDKRCSEDAVKMQKLIKVYYNL